MTSSISHSRRGSFVVLCCSLAGSLALSVFYTLHINPEIKFWKAAFEKKRVWSERIRQEGRPLNVFSGGSSCFFQVNDGFLTKEAGIPSVNAGMAAGMGVDGTLGLASTLLQPGDRLVLMTEPAMLAEGGGDLTSMALQMRVATGRQEGFLQEEARRGAWKAWGACRPGLYHSVTMLGKVIAGRPAYRYSIADMYEGGFIATSVRNDVKRQVRAVQKLRLSLRARRLLVELRAWAAARKIELVYLLPVAYVPPDLAEEQRIENLKLLNDIGGIIPVWKDEYLGVSSTASDFADTALHMTEDAAAGRTRALAKLLAENPLGK